MNAISIRLGTNKAGKPVAHYWGAARRWLPISVNAANLALATGTVFGKPAGVAAKTSDPYQGPYTSVDGDVWSV